MHDRAKHDADLEEVRRRLYSWGRWYNHILLSSLGYAQRTIIGKLMESKGTMIRSTAINYIPTNEPAEEIEKFISALKNFKPKWAKVVKYHYSNTGDSTEKSKALELQERNYRDCLLKGTKWINSRLEDKKKSTL